MAGLELGVTEQMDYETFVKTISNIPSCIFIKDKELKYIFSSHRWGQLISDDIIGKTDVDIRKDKENAIQAMESDREIIRTGKGSSYEIMSDIDGVVSYLELIKEPIIDSKGEVIGIVGLINDVTEKTIMENKIVKMSEELEVQCRELETSNEELKDTLEKVEKMHESQKMFTASMNHELRSPLNGIIGNLQLLLEDEGLNQEQMDNLRNAYTSSQMMLDIVNELLDFAKIEMSNFSINNEAFSILEILNNIKLPAEIQAKAKGLEFTLVKEESVQNCYIGDKTRISQIIQNLVSNAIKYTEEGYVTLKISYIDNSLVIVCSDTGQGISEESMDALFDPFVRFNEKRNAKIQGTGLGLSVVKKIIDMMDGEISVSSKLNEGSVFTVRIPAETAKEEDCIISVKEVGNIDYSNVEFDKLKALCIDDSKVNAKVMVSILKKIGLDAEAAYSAKEGIDKADTNHYDMIFMDHMMPEMDGIEAFEYIRSNSILNSKTPVIMLTGNAGSSFGELYARHGIDGWLIKPILKEQIMEKIASIIQKKS